MLLHVFHYLHFQNSSQAKNTIRMDQLVWMHPNFSTMYEKGDFMTLHNLIPHMHDF